MEQFPGHDKRMGEQEDGFDMPIGGAGPMSAGARCPSAATDREGKRHCTFRHSAVQYRKQENAMRNTSQTARLEARISPDLHTILKRAAELQGSSVTQFVVAAVQKAAEQAIEDAGLIRLSLADQRCFAEALCSPPPANAALKRAFKKRDSLLSGE
jgi:uncharacterized protein (DUF1778 family)